MIYTLATKLQLKPAEAELLARDLTWWNATLRQGFTWYSKKQDDQGLHQFLQNLTGNSAQADSLTCEITGKWLALVELQKTHQAELTTKIQALTSTLKKLQKQHQTAQKIITTPNCPEDNYSSNWL